VGYCAWANRQLLAACSALTEEEIKRDLRISHNSIISTFRHIYDGERIWLVCLCSTKALGTWRLPQDPPPELVGLSLAALIERWAELSKNYRRWLEELPPEGIDSEIRVQLPNGSAPQLTRWKILRHVLEHSTLHRGQIVGMIRALDHCPPAIHRMDYCLAGEPRE
jgi:uncharacterized damage-inducible protein DinB